MERDEYNGLDLYDFHARWYDQELCQFTTMDPLCERYYDISPYAYCAGDPVNNIDPTGMAVWSTRNPQTILEFFNDLKYSATASTGNFELEIDDDYFLNNYYSNGSRYSVGYGWSDSPNGIQFEGGYSVLSFEASTSFDFQSLMGDFFSRSKKTRDCVNVVNGTAIWGFFGMQEQGLSYMARKNSGLSFWKFEYKQSARLQAIKTVRAMGKADARYLYAMKGIGKASLFISAATSICSFTESAKSDRPDKGARMVKAGLDLVFAGVGAYGGPWGWGISGAYFLADACGVVNWALGIKKE